MSQDAFYSDPEEDDFPTYVSIRPDWSDDRWIRRGGGKVMTFRRDTTETYVRRDSTPRKGSEFSRPIVTSVEEYDTPKRTIKIGYRKQRETLKSSGRFVGRPSTKHTISNELFERLQLYDMFGENTFDFEVQIGIVDPDAKHIGFNGRAVSYSGLFEKLTELGYSPLAPLLNENIIREVRRSLASTILSSIRHRGPKDSIARKVEVWARNVRDMVRDYIRGQNAIESKPSLEDSTIYIRNSRLKEHGDLYKYGTANALWESGTLESDITFKVIPLRKITLSPYERKVLKDIEDSKKGSKAAQKKATSADKKLKKGAKSIEKKQGRAAKNETFVDPIKKYRDEFWSKVYFVRGLLDKAGRRKQGLTYGQSVAIARERVEKVEKAGKPLSENMTEFKEAYARALDLAIAYGFDINNAFL